MPGQVWLDSGVIVDRKRIALIGYLSDYFGAFGKNLEVAGFDVFWVQATRSAARYQNNGFPRADRVLDTTAGFDPKRHPPEVYKAELATLEVASGLRIHDIILMDRLVRLKSYDFALGYLHHLRTVVTRFFVEHKFELVSSGRDTALQMIALSVARELKIPWVVPTRIRIPQNRFMFCSGHETADMIKIREVTAADRDWAERFVHDYQNRSVKPVLRAAAMSFGDVARMLPLHARLFAGALKTALWDVGNNYSRYTVPRMIQLYLRRRVNMVMFKLARPFQSPASRPFCFYPLHTQPESSIDVAGSFFSNQVALITFIARSLPATHDLYVKIHQTDVDGKTLAFYRTVGQIPGVRIIGYQEDSRPLIERASICFVLTGTVGYEAGLIGRPVITFAKNYYNALPTIHYCGAPPTLPELIDAVIDAPPPEGWRARVVEFMATLKAQSFAGEVNRMWQRESAGLNDADLSALRDTYTELYRAVTAGPR